MPGNAGQERLCERDERDAGDQQDRDLQRHQQRPPRRRRQIQLAVAARRRGQRLGRQRHAERARDADRAQDERDDQDHRGADQQQARDAGAKCATRSRAAAAGDAASDAAITIAASSATSPSAAGPGGGCAPSAVRCSRRRAQAVHPGAVQRRVGLQRARQPAIDERPRRGPSARISHGVSSVVIADTATATG